MSILNLKVQGIRSFKNLTSISFAMPDGNTDGSGLNMLVGPNNSGKSSLIETLYLSNNNLDMIPNSIRNTQSINGIQIEINFDNGNVKKISSMQNNPAFINNIYVDNNGEKLIDNRPFAYILSSKRNIGINLTTHSSSWQSFLHNNGGHNYRQENLSNNIGSRFINIIESNKELFDYELKEIIGYLPEWSLDSNDANSLFISFKEGLTQHNNSGSGDGFINLFVILTSLYDAPPNSTIVIDEPEIALHPDVQQKLMERLKFHSRNKQIIISTHSPYFIDLNLLNYGAKIFRFYKENESTNIYTIKPEHISCINSLLNTIEQPYLQDIKSKEIFFLDKLILVEGPDDIYGYESLFKKFDYKTSGNFYGWGVGGAERIEHLLHLLSDLHYTKVVIILDNDKKNLGKKIANLYPDYKILIINAKDIRDKEPPNIKKIKKIINKMQQTLSNESCNVLNDFLSQYINDNTIKGIIIDRKKISIHKEYEDNINDIICQIQQYFNDTAISNNERIYNLILSTSNKNMARKILDDYIIQHPEKVSKFIENKYYNYNFKSGGGHSTLVRNDKNLYYYEIIQSASTENQQQVTFKIEIEINIEKSKVTNIKYTELENTLKK